MIKPKEEEKENLMVASPSNHTSLFSHSNVNPDTHVQQTEVKKEQTEEKKPEPPK